MVLRRIGGRRVIASTVLARASDIVVIVVFHLENMRSLSNLLSKTSDKDMSHRKGLRIGGRWVTASTGAGTSQWGPGARRGNIVRHRKHLRALWASTCVCVKLDVVEEETFVNTCNTHTGNLSTKQLDRNLEILKETPANKSNQWSLADKYGGGSKCLGISAN